MVAILTTSTITSVPFNSSTKLGRLQNHVRVQRSTFTDNVQNPSITSSANILKTGNHEVASLLPSSRNSYNPTIQDLGLNFYLFTKEIIEKAIERNEVQQLIDTFGPDKLAQDGLSYCENLRIHSFEIGANGTVSMETLMNHLQEVGLNHLKCAGILGDGLYSSPEMYKRDLIWVTTKVQIVINRYPTWGDAVQIETSIAPSGKTHMRRDSVVRDRITGNVLVRASSKWVLMNIVTRKLCRIPNEVRDEFDPYVKDAEAPPLVENDNKKPPKLVENTADFVRSGLRPGWGDIDINQHVNNSKYVAWILESVPSTIMKNSQLSQITIEYRRECYWDDVLRSLTVVSDSSPNDSANSEVFAECAHSLRLEDGSEVVKARTEWRCK